MDFPSDREANVLRQLLVSDRYGLELAAGSDGTISRNTVYVLLAKMTDKRIVASRLVETPSGSTGPARRVYRITALGRAQLAAYAAAQAAMKGSKR